MDNKVMVENLTSRRVVLRIPEVNLKAVFEKKGVKRPINIEVLQQALYDSGVEYMFTQGILGIDNMEQKKFLGLEPEDATAPQNIIILTENQKTRLLTVAPLRDLKETLETLPYEQIRELASFAIEHEYTNIDKCDLLKKYTQIDIIKAVQLNRQNKED